MIPEIEELLNIGKELNINIELLTDNESKVCINNILNLFNPFKVTWNIYAKKKDISFFEQVNNANKRMVVKIENLKLLGKILEKSFGMEYFLTNEKMDFLIAVNWYVIEVSGTAKETRKKVYYQFEGQPAQNIIDKLYEYSKRYGIDVIIDTTPLGVVN